MAEDKKTNEEIAAEAAELGVTVEELEASNAEDAQLEKIAASPFEELGEPGGQYIEDDAHEDVIEYMTPEDKAAFSRKATATNWRIQIVKYLTKDDCANNNATDVEIYDATRPDTRDKLSAKQKIKNLASQLTYLRDDGYSLSHDDGRVIVVADPKDRIYPGARKFMNR